MSSVPEVSSEERELYQGVSDTPASYAREGADVHYLPELQRDISPLLDVAAVVASVP